jgi:hypothetical protein
MISFYQKKLQELHTIPNPTVLMKRIITTMNTPNECVYIYEATLSYASLFLSNETGTIYFYPSLQCSLLPPPKPFINKKDKIENKVYLDPIWLHKIVNIDHEARYQSDQDILIYKNDCYRHRENKQEGENKKEEKEKEDESIQLHIPHIQDKESEKEKEIEKTTRYVSVSLDDDVKSETSTISRSSTSSISGIKPSKKPVPLHLRPKWKR